MFDKALGLFNHHLRDLHMAGRWFVKRRTDHFALHRPLHVGHFLRALVDEQNDEVALRMIGGHRVGDILQENGLAGPRRRNDQTTLSLAQRRHNIDHPGREVLPCRITGFHLQAFIRVERRQIVEMHLVPCLLRILEVDGVDLDQGKIPFTLLGAPNLAFNGITGPQRELPDLAR